MSHALERYLEYAAIYRKYTEAAKKADGGINFPYLCRLMDEKWAEIPKKELEQIFRGMYDLG